MWRGAVKSVDHASHFAKLFHEVIARMQAAGSIDDQDVGSPGTGSLPGIIGHGSRVGAGLVADHVHAHPLTQYFQLLFAAARKVSAAPRTTRLPAWGEMVSQLCNAGGFSDPVDPAHEDDVGRR